MRKAGTLSDDAQIFDTTQTQPGRVRTTGVKALGRFLARPHVVNVPPNNLESDVFNASC